MTYNSKFKFIPTFNQTYTMKYDYTKTKKNSEDPYINIWQKNRVGFRVWIYQFVDKFIVGFVLEIAHTLWYRLLQ